MDWITLSVIVAVATTIFFFRRYLLVWPIAYGVGRFVAWTAVQCARTANDLEEQGADPEVVEHYRRKGTVEWAMEHAEVLGGAVDAIFVVDHWTAL